MCGADAVDASDGALVPVLSSRGGPAGGQELDDSLKARLKKAFHALAKKYHPDLGKQEHYTKFQVLAQAYADLTKDSNSVEEEDQVVFLL